MRSGLCGAARRLGKDLQGNAEAQLSESSSPVDTKTHAKVMELRPTAVVGWGASRADAGPRCPCPEHGVFGGRTLWHANRGACWQGPQSSPTCAIPQPHAQGCHRAVPGRGSRAAPCCASHHMAGSGSGKATGRSSRAGIRESGCRTKPELFCGGVVPSTRRALAGRPVVVPSSRAMRSETTRARGPSRPAGSSCPRSVESRAATERSRDPSFADWKMPHCFERATTPD
mmetsp:Transcript_57434/g.163088  ORF Transcript_57434/g.163088 Transcript_57434/m.163088 type:complete len:229 (-) Transcript_57434:664-1350(-)